jgi:hypothetical protein
LAELGGTDYKDLSMRVMHLMLLAILAVIATPAEALRCGNKLVLDGMTRYEVRQRCGEPDDMSRYYRTVYRQSARDESVAIDIEIEEWFYDFGSNRLNRRLIFVNGRLQKEEIAD